MRYWIRRFPQWLSLLPDRRMRWSDLRAAGNSPVVRASMLMPVIGYLVLLNGRALEMADIDARFRFIASENPWRLLFIYYGTSILGFASLVYALKCPTQIRKYDSAVEYRNTELEFHNNELHRHFRKTQAKIAANNLSKASRSAGIGLERLIEEKSDNQYISGEYLTQLLDCDWRINNVSKRSVRIACWLTYRIGFGLLLVPTLATFLEVSIYVATMISNE